MTISTFLDIIDPERTMILSHEIEYSKNSLTTPIFIQVKATEMFHFISIIRLDSGWNQDDLTQLKNEILSIPWRYIENYGTNRGYLNFTKEDYEVWKVKSYLTGLCKPL